MTGWEATDMGEIRGRPWGLLRKTKPVCRAQAQGIWAANDRRLRSAGQILPVLRFVQDDKRARINHRVYDAPTYAFCGRNERASA